MKALFTYRYDDEKMKKIQDLGYEVKYIHENEIDDDNLHKDADVLVCYSPFKRISLDTFDDLKLIQLSSIGIDQLPKEDALRLGITVCNNRGGYSIPMGEWIVLKILEIMKHSRDIEAMQRERKWKMDTGLLELYGKKVHFLGTGTIAREAAKRLSGFDVHLTGYNRSGKIAQHFDRCIPAGEMNKTIGEAEVVVIALPSTASTHHLVDRELLDKMKEGSILVNIARGDIVDEKALIDSADKFLGIALDVFETEPLNEESPLWGMENVHISAHNSWISEMRNERRFDIILENLSRFIRGENLKNVVDIERGY